MEEPDLRSLEEDRRVRHFADDIADYLTEVAFYLDIFEGDADHVAEDCDDLCGHRLCDNCGCIKYRIRAALVLQAKAKPEAAPTQ